MAWAAKVLDGASAGDRLLGFKTVKQGTCLNAVWRAFGSPKGDGAYPYSTAMQALKRARELGAIKGTNIKDAPEGAVLYWSNVWGNWSAGWSDAGHIAIKGPNNTVTSIDRPRNGVVGRVKPSGIWSHLKFEGWALGEGAFMGHTVTSPADLTLDQTKPASGSKPSKVKATEEEKTEQELDMAGTMFRIGSGQGTGGIFWQDGPNEPLLPLDYTQYATYANQGYKYVNYDAQVIQQLQRRCGVYELDKPHGRKIVAEPGDKSQRNGFKVWLPG